MDAGAKAKGQWPGRIEKKPLAGLEKMKILNKFLEEDEVPFLFFFFSFFFFFCISHIVNGWVEEI